MFYLIDGDVLPRKHHCFIEKTIIFLKNFYNLNSNNNDVVITFIDNMNKKAGKWGSCRYIKDKNLFHIKICVNNINFMIETLCHEFVHVKQFIYDDLNIDAENSSIMFKGYKYVGENFSHPQNLWEQEAYRMQTELYTQLINTLSYDDLEYLKGQL